MTIPSRPAPPPPQPATRKNENHSQASNKLPSLTLFPKASHTKYRYGTITSTAGSLLPPEKEKTINKKKPPPRPPPPKNLNTRTGDTVLSKPGPPQSINMLSNFFGKKRGKQNPLKFVQPKIQLTAKTSQNTNNLQLQSFQQNSEIQLISFDSPPSSPTLTQKSNSDCVSIDSFSSDSNFSSPINGNASQPESGFEDDFVNPTDPWEAVVNDSFKDNTRILINGVNVTQPIRNPQAINNIQPDNTLCNGKSLIPPPSILATPTIIKPKTLQNQRNSPTAGCLVFGKTTESNLKELSKCNFYEESFLSLPMPSCPPPPPPSNASNVLAVITGKLDAIDLVDAAELEGSSYGIALYDFDGIEDTDLSFRKNEKLYLLQRLNEEWYLGRNRSGCEGILPANYIDVKVKLKDDYQFTQHNTEIVKSKYNSNQARVIYKFSPEASEDLSLNIGEIITILYRINEDWLYGEIENRRGQFPENFVEYLPENLPQT